MRLYLKSRDGIIDALADYNPEDGVIVVLKGSHVSDRISNSKTFRGKASICKLRELNVVNDTVTSDIIFKSASTAANFITGTSTNGLITWKDKDGTKLKDLIGGGGQV